ncbi:hypothetical protein D9M72_496020 [compost metagenome]
MARQHGLAALYPVQHCRYRRAVLDDDVAAALEPVGDKAAGEFAGLGIVGLHGGIGAGGGHIDRHHHDAGLARLAYRRLDGAGVGGVDQDQVDAGDDKAVDVHELLVQVVVRRQHGDLYLRVDLPGRGLGTAAQRDEIWIAQRAQRHAYLPERTLRGPGIRSVRVLRGRLSHGRCRAQRGQHAGRQGFEDGLDHNVSPVRQRVRYGRSPSGDSGRARPRR